MNITTAEAVNLHLNWRTLRAIIERDIRVSEAVAESMADSERTVTRQHAKMETLREILADMNALEKATTATGAGGVMAALADLPDLYCADCGHSRGTDCGCSCTGPGTCGGGTDDLEGT